MRAASEELRNRWLATLREGWTPAVVPQTGMGFEADEDGRSTEARRYKSMRFSDGGTVANNPTFIALLEAWALYGAPGSSLHDFVGRQVVFDPTVLFDRGYKRLILYSSLTSQQIGITNIWKRHCSEQDCVVSVGTGDPPPRQLRDGMGAKRKSFRVCIFVCTAVECRSIHTFVCSQALRSLCGKFLSITRHHVIQMCSYHRCFRKIAMCVARTLPTRVLPAWFSFCSSFQLFQPC